MRQRFFFVSFSFHKMKRIRGMFLSPKLILCLKKKSFVSPGIVSVSPNNNV